MKNQFLMLIGLSFFSMTAFSQQQISNSKKLAQPQVVPVETITSHSEEQPSDSIAVNSMNKQANPSAPVEPPTNQGSTTGKPALNSTQRKPE